MTPFVVIVPVWPLVPSPRAPILFNAEFTVAVPLPLLMVRLVPAPVTVLLVLAPT